MKVNAPVPALIVKSPASAPPTIEYVGAPPSMSVEVTVVTAVWFSAALTAAVAPPPFDVMTGASLTLVTLTAIACVSLPPLPSLTCTVTSYTLFAPASVGVSKSGTATKVNAPVLGLMVNSEASAPPTML